MMRLIDCFMKLIVYVVELVRHIEQDQPDFASVKNDIDKLLTETMKIKTENHFSDQSYKYARLFVSSWIDEALLNSEWQHKRKWQRATLQRRFFNITDAGMVFFNCMKKLGHEDRDLREVIYYCLILGFAGRYIRKGDSAVLDNLKTSNLKRLYGSSAGEPTLENRQLFSEAYQKELLKAQPKKRMWSWRAVPFIIGFASVGLFAGLMLFYQYMLKVDLNQFIPM